MKKPITIIQYKQVESLLNKLESLPDNVKQVAVSKIRARLLKKGIYIMYT